jgi:hypothetical protein
VVGRGGCLGGRGIFAGKGFAKFRGGVEPGWGVWDVHHRPQVMQKHCPLRDKPGLYNLAADVGEKGPRSRR